MVNQRKFIFDCKSERTIPEKCIPQLQDTPPEEFILSGVITEYCSFVTVLNH